MIDHVVSLPRIQTLHPSLREEAETIIERIEQNGVFIRVVYGLRTFEQQSELYEQGRTRPGKIVTYAKPGTSWHNYGLALDFCLITKDLKYMYDRAWDVQGDYDGDGISDWLEVVKEFERHGWKAGARWKTWDPEAAELTDEEMLAGKRGVDNPHVQLTYGLTITEALRRYREKDFVEEGYIRI